jgi:hypothetical protein
VTRPPPSSARRAIARIAAAHAGAAVAGTVAGLWAARRRG